MRIFLTASILAFMCTPLASASSPLPLPDPAALLQLDLHAGQADPRERSFLYAELAHIYTEIAGQQLAIGDLDHATLSLEQVGHYADLIHTELGRNSRRLKNSELLMHEATSKLGELVRYVSSDNKAVVQTALRQMNKVNEEILAQVFAH